MDIVQVLTLIGVAIANIGTTITLFIWSTTRSDENRKETNALVHCIHRETLQEMKDFHARLCDIESKKVTK